MIRLLLLGTLLMPLLACAEDAQIAKRFSEHGVQGTLVLRALNSGETLIHGDARAQQRFTVASTFKILNTLIAAEEGVADAQTRFKWDGQQRSIAAWNQDQSLRSAFQLSCVWCYQQLAQTIGLERYRHYLHGLNYGQFQQPAELTRFWLNGQLRVSALEQIDLLQRIVRRQPPFSGASYDILKQAMQVDDVLYAKTGLAADTSPQIGWYVGYVQTATDSWLFALNIDVRGNADVATRLELTRQVLEDKGILPTRGD